MTSKIYSTIIDKQNAGKKQFAVLIDPDKFESSDIIDIANEAKVDYFFLGGSLITTGSIEKCIETIKKKSKIPVILFPGSSSQITAKADALLFLSLISGRNPEMLIGKHVIAAPLIKSMNLEVISTGYMLIESGKQTTALYMSNTMPIPNDKDEIAVCTALAGEMLGLKLIYMDAGSGALNPVSISMIQMVKKSISVPLIIGGGIKTPELALAACNAGADIIVVGNAIEKNKSLIKIISNVIHSYPKMY